MWREWNEIDRMFRAMDLLNTRMNRLYSDTEGYRISSFPSGMTQAGPRTNLYDSGDHLLITAEVPGIAKEDLNIRLQGNYLEISGARKPDNPDGYSRHRMERAATSFSRSFTLPSEIDSSKVEASLKDGILTLTLPKVEAAKPKQITIN
jgi:HSP20 family protein